jgi:hypothetical protein
MQRLFFKSDIYHFRLIPLLLYVYLNSHFFVIRIQIGKIFDIN